MARTQAPFPFDPTTLAALARARRGDFLAGNPFPHVVFDDFLPEPVIEAVIDEFPGPDSIAWERHVNAYAEKLASNDEAAFGPVTRQLLAQFNSGVFLTFLEKLTGIPALLPDPYFHGGGLHQITRGGRLGIHADFNRYERLNLDRRLNLLLYLNRDWDEAWGGHLELWDREMTHAVQRVLPVANRAVLFATTDDSMHGHPDPLRCPETRTRRSMALYYYTAPTAVADGVVPHSTLYRRRPGERIQARDVLRGFANRAAKGLGKLAARLRE